MLTAKFSHTANDWLSFFNDTRLEFQDRKYSATRVSCASGLPNTAPVGTPPLPGSCLFNFYDGNPATVAQFAAGGAASATGPYEMQAWGIQDIGTGVAEFHTFGLKNRATAGFDISYQRSDRNFYNFSPSRPNRDPFNPDHDFVYSFVPPTASGAAIESFAQGTDYAAFMSDQLWLTPELSIAAGVRWDSYYLRYAILETDNYLSVTSSSDFFSPKASLVWQPTPNQTYYFSWAKGQTPQGTSITNLPTPISTTDNTINQRDLDPEESENLEIGAKIGLLDNRLAVNTAIFQVTKTNSKETDGSGAIINSGDKQRVHGFELGVAGEVFKAFYLSANYTFLSSETLFSTTGTPAVLNTGALGKAIPNAPRNAFSIWATYEPIEHLTVGFGPTYRDAVWLNNTHTAIAPETVNFDALLEYQFEHVRFSLNGLNLTDALNYSGTQGGRVVPAPGRSVVFTVGLSF
jgi:catecholate siderophore receptor